MPLARHRKSVSGSGRPRGFLAAALCASLAPAIFFIGIAETADDAKGRGLLVMPVQVGAPVAPADGEDFIEGNYWALIIGINTYPSLGPDKQLTAARKDAERVAKLLSVRYGFSRERMIELYDEQASLKAIIHAFSELKHRLSDKDSLLIYYAGHGEYEGTGTDRRKADKMGYWIPADGERDDPATYLFNSQVRDYLINIRAQHIYTVVDSYFSNSLLVRTRALSLGRGAIKELYSEKSRWVLVSGGLYPVPDLADKAKEGHSAFAWHFTKILSENTNPYLLGKDIVESLAARVTGEAQGPVPRGAPLAVGDEGGQFVFRLRKDMEKRMDPAPAELAQDPQQEKANKEPEKAVEKKIAERAKPIEEARVRPFESPLQVSREIVGKDGAPMVLIPAGEFTMGSDDEKPAHRVYVDAVYFDKYELTTARYAQFMKAIGRKAPDRWNEVNIASHGDRPVIGVDWYDADTYCRWTGKRLPTEAEWEKAARGSDGRLFPWGNEGPTSQTANFGKCCDWKGYAILAPVGSLEAGKSPYGLYDMAGNVYEWVADWYGPHYYRNSPPRNPKGPAAGEYKVLRGGSWHSPSKQDVRSTLRLWDVPTAQTGAIGFRCAQDAPK